VKTTPMDIRSHQFKKTLRGYDPRDVEVLKDLAAEALEDAGRDIASLEERLKDAMTRLDALVGNETVLRETLTTAQRMVEELKGGARKEADLIIAEAKLQGEGIVRQAQTRLQQLQEEIFRLKKQRKELETSIKAVIDYHSSVILLEEEEATRADEAADRVRPFGRKE